MDVVLSLILRFGFPDDELDLGLLEVDFDPGLLVTDLDLDLELELELELDLLDFDFDLVFSELNELVCELNLGLDGFVSGFVFRSGELIFLGGELDFNGGEIDFLGGELDFVLDLRFKVDLGFLGNESLLPDLSSASVVESVHSADGPVSDEDSVGEFEDTSVVCPDVTASTVEAGVASLSFTFS